MLSIADVVILLIIFGFTFAGFFFGFIHTLGSLVGTIAGFFVASHFSSVVADWLEPVLGGGGVVRVVLFVLLFLLVSRLAGFLFWLAEKAFHFISIIPFLKSINRLLGAVLGVIEGVIVVGAALYYSSTILPEWFYGLIVDTRLGGSALAVFKTLFVYVF